jgi:hypothetical protein
MTTLRLVPKPTSSRLRFKLSASADSKLTINDILMFQIVHILMCHGLELLTEPPTFKVPDNKKIAMRYLFPIRSLCNFSRKNKYLTYGVFFLCLIVAIVKGYLREDKQNPYALINFFDHWTGLSKNAFDTIIKLLYTPIGMIIWLLFVFILFLWLLYVLSGLKSKIKFKEFVFPFLSLCYLGLFLWIVSFVLTFSSIQIPYSIRMIIFIYWFAFYYIILIQEYGLKPARGISSIVLSFFIVFILGGFPSIAPYLQWILNS